MLVESRLVWESDRLRPFFVALQPTVHAKQNGKRTLVYSV